MSGPAIYAFVPAFRNQMTASTMLSIVGLSQTLMSKGIGFAISAVSWPDIADLRGMAATYLVDRMPANVTHLLFIDDDMAAPSELVLDQLLFNKPVVGALYPKRALPIEFAGTGSENPETSGPFVKCDGIGMGYALIQRHVFEMIADKMPETVDTSLHNSGLKEMFGGEPLKRILKPFEKMRRPDTNGQLSEDFSFCQRWRMLGGEVWAHGGFNIQHYGLHCYEANFRDWSNQKAAEKAAMQQAAE